MIVCFCIVITLLLAKPCLALMTIKGPETVQRNERFQVQCTADVTPVDDTVEFIVNEKTEDTLRRFENECFSTKSGKNCSKDICNCSDDGLKYNISIRAMTESDSLNITCSMKLSPNSHLFTQKSITVNIYEWKTDTSDSSGIVMSNPVTTVYDASPNSMYSSTGKVEVNSDKTERDHEGPGNFVNAYTIGSLTAGLFLLFIISILAISAYTKLVCKRHNSKTEFPISRIQSETRDIVLKTTEDADTNSNYESIDESQLVEHQNVTERNPEIDAELMTHGMVPSVSHPEAIYLEVIDDIEKSIQYGNCDSMESDQGYETPVSAKHN